VLNVMASSLASQLLQVFFVQTSEF
jgi:hypothetical protein